MAISGSDKALMYALGGVMRGGASRGGYVSGHVFIAIDGVQNRQNILMDSLTITDELDETANKCTFRIIAGSTTPGKPVRITLGSINNGSPLFAGHVVQTQFSYWQRTDRLSNYFCDCTALDYSWIVGFVKVTKKYTNQSATDIAKDLVATYGAVNGFTSANVAPGLPVLEEITYTNEDLTDALTRLARRIGAYWYVDYQKDVHLFFEEVNIPPPRDLTPTHPTLSDVSLETDRSQALSRVYIEGRGSRLLSDVPIGDTMLPLDAVDMFSPVTSDVFLKASFQGADGGAQHLTYTGVVPGGAGTVVGPGIGPTTAPTLTRQAGTGVTGGLHRYAVTFVTPSGESLPGPPASITAGQQVANPTAYATGWTPPSNYFGNLHKLGFYRVKYAYATDTAWPPAEVTLASPTSDWIQANDNSGATSEQGSIQTSIPCSSDPAVKFVVVYRTTNGGSTFYRATRETNVPGATIPSSSGSVPSDATIVTQGTEPVANTTPTSGAVAITAIPVGAATVTQRKIYRTAAITTVEWPLQLLATLANNTTTAYTDVLPDASLGANVPVADTSALPQPAGSVLPGSTVLPVAGTSAFLAGGGWVVIGNGEQVVRYTGLTASTLTGIPASGTGSITAAVNYNSTLTAAPMLTGLPASGSRSIGPRPLTAGDEIYLVVQVDDTARQALLAADLGGNGIREEWDQDRRLSIAEARSRGTALLQLRAIDQGRLSYRCRDLTTKSGKTIFCNLPSITVYLFKIQRVTISNFRPYPNQYPTFTVEAASSRYSFEDLLRSAKTKE